MVLHQTIVFMSLIAGLHAPFPEEHPFNSFNPWIEPWWNQLTESEREVIYSHWEEIEPIAMRGAEAVEAKRRALEALIGMLDFKNYQRESDENASWGSLKALFQHWISEAYALKADAVIRKKDLIRKHINTYDRQNVAQTIEKFPLTEDDLNVQVL